MMASYTMASIGLVIFGLCVLLVPIASSKRCTYDCEWEDEELTLCDDRFVYIFSGKVVRVFGGERRGYVDYDVEMTEIFRGEGNDVFVGSVVTLRTMYDKHICPVRTMKEGDYFYFAVGQQSLKFNYRIFSDSCNSYIMKAHEFTGTVFADLLNGKFKVPCYS
ncbi:uncharacterized protein LOC117306590 [Asterias rubens]|uniref:uncharacterized protein LOC117306590 n=1 Tax=Asterias rubens TaxID=7604 RepID=UPI0014555F8A|nr:uncharacterized protein LOC117306590 [Asterias rubens]